MSGKGRWKIEKEGEGNKRREGKGEMKRGIRNGNMR